MQTALNDFDYNKAGANEVMTFAASLYFLDPEHLSGESSTEIVEVSPLMKEKLMYEIAQPKVQINCCIQAILSRQV